MRVLVCGGRDYNDYERVEKFLTALQEKRGPIDLIIHGAARGADSLADRYARENEIPVMRFPAEWAIYGNAAGPIRNAKMAREGKPDVVVFFPGGRGTASMKNIARKCGIEVLDGTLPL